MAEGVDVRPAVGAAVAVPVGAGVREGVTRRDDCLPRRFREEPLREGMSAGAVFNQELMLDDYYRERGWDLRTGIPTRVSLETLGLGYIADELERMGKTIPSTS